MSLLEKDSSKQGEVSQSLENMEFDEGDAHDYVIAGVVNSAVFESGENDKAEGLYYQVHWEEYPDSENTWKPYEGVSHLRKLLNKFHKKHPNKSTVESVIIERKSQRRVLKRSASKNKDKNIKESVEHS